MWQVLRHGRISVSAWGRLVGVLEEETTPLTRVVLHIETAPVTYGHF